MSADQTKIKLNLRKGVQFHSGREFTSDDIEYNLLRARDPKNGFAAVVAPGSAWWTSIEKPDKYTIILTSEKPRPGVYDLLNFLRIQDKDVREGPDAATKVGGTGPFKWMEWVPGDHITDGQEQELLGERPSVPGRVPRSRSSATSSRWSRRWRPAPWTSRRWRRSQTPSA